MPTKANRAIGSLDFPDSERRQLAIKSRSWRCESCGLIKDLLIPVSSSNEEDKLCHNKPDEAVTSPEVCNDQIEARRNQDDLSSDVIGKLILVLFVLFLLYCTKKLIC